MARRKPKPDSDASQGYIAPALSSDLTFRTQGSSGLRQYGGWVREEFLPQLVGRQAARTYREMQDNSPAVGAILFAIQQSMRQATWRVEPANDSAAAREAAAFVDSCRDDMSHSWTDFIAESLSMLPYGFAVHEIVYKRRMGRDVRKGQHKSKYDDGRIGWAKLPLRGQDTVIKWFFDDEGDITGLTQQPYYGGLIDIPIEKLLLFRPKAHKNNPEGYSILRTAYRPWFFLKRLEEQEAIALERMSGTPEYRVPGALLEAAAAGDTKASAALSMFKRIVTNIRIDEQMGLITPSDVYQNQDGTLSNVPMYEFKYNVPQAGRGGANFDPSIDRYKLDIMTSVLADFLSLGHDAHGTQSLADNKVDLFLKATEGWMQANADVLNNCALPRLWKLNGFDDALMPTLRPDMPQRTDLDALSAFLLRLNQAGMTLFPDAALEEYLRDVSDLPETSKPSPPMGERAG